MINIKVNEGLNHILECDLHLWENTRQDGSCDKLQFSLLKHDFCSLETI